MSFTSLELVNKHINFEDYQAGTKKNYPVSFTDYDWLALPGKNLIDGTVKVKITVDLSPVQEAVTMAATPVDLTYTDLVDGSVVAASDLSLGTIYRETVDFNIDYEAGKISLISGGGLSESDEVIIWYYKYALYEENSDYRINYQSGKVSLLTGGDIAFNQTVLIDYSLSATQLNDELISEAVAEANIMVAAEIDSGQDFGADLTLQTAATYLAVSLVCRMAAAGDLVISTVARSTASSWLSLSQNYRDDFEILIKPFRAGRSRLKRPTHS